MNTKRTLKIAPFLLALALAAITAAISAPVAAESAAELLEKGIYTEQTVGDLAAAIEIYTRLIGDEKANRPHVAEAQFRLGMCHLKGGRDVEARAAFERLVRDFPEQERLVAEAREQLATVGPGLELAEVPWEDGEALEYRMSLPTGKVIGSLHLRAESTLVDGIEAWRLELRRFIATNADGYGVSRILVDHATQRPLSSTLRHGILGTADASFGPDGIEISGPATQTSVDSSRQVYDNDQSMHLIRMLPLEPGYEVTISFIPLWTAQVVEAHLKVKAEETCRVPAGEFECYAVDLDIEGHQQSLWISSDSRRYPVKLEGGGVVLELAEIGRIDPGAPVPFGMEDFGFSGTLAAGWMPHEHRMRADKAMIRLLDPEAAAISAVEVDRCPRGKCPELKQTAERELSGARRRFANYQLREGSWRERTIDGRPAISFTGDYEREGEPWVQYRIYTFLEEVRLELIFRTPADRFEELRAVFDSVAEGLRSEA